MDWLTRQDFEAARSTIAPTLHRTPLLSFRTLGEATGVQAFLKCENLQKTGSFKVRGALHSIARLSDAERQRGVITISAGNHAQAVAWAAAKAGVEAVVVMPKGASETKVAATRAYGARVILHGNAAEAFAEALARAERDGLTFLHPFDSLAVIAGHGSTGLEIDEDLDRDATVVVPVGGGGQISGIAGALSTSGHSHRVFGVEPRGAPAMRRSLDQGSPAHLESTDTIADGLAPPMAGTLNYQFVSRFVEDVVLVSDDELLAAMRLLMTRAKLMVEPSGAAAVAALMFGRIPVTEGSTVVAVISGGNVDDPLVERALRKGEPWP